MDSYVDSPYKLTDGDRREYEPFPTHPDDQSSGDESRRNGFKRSETFYRP